VAHAILLSSMDSRLGGWPGDPFAITVRRGKGAVPRAARRRPSIPALTRVNDFPAGAGRRGPNGFGGLLRKFSGSRRV